MPTGSLRCRSPHHTRTIHIDPKTVPSAGGVRPGHEIPVSTSGTATVCRDGNLEPMLGRQRCSSAWLNDGKQSVCPIPSRRSRMNWIYTCRWCGSITHI